MYGANKILLSWVFCNLCVTFQDSIGSCTFAILLRNLTTLIVFMAGKRFRLIFTTVNLKELELLRDLNFLIFQVKSSNSKQYCIEILRYRPCIEESLVSS